MSDTTEPTTTLGKLIGRAGWVPALPWLALLVLRLGVAGLDGCLLLLGREVYAHRI